MSKKKPARVTAAFIMTVALVIGIGAGPFACDSRLEPTVVTRECTDALATSLVARGEVEDVGGGDVLTRGFVYKKGTQQDTGPAIFSLDNFSFESGNPPTGWEAMHGDLARSSDQAKLGSYSGKLTQDSAGQWAIAYVTISDPDTVEAFQGKTVTFGAWVWSDAPDRLVRIGIGDRVDGTYQWSGADPHPGDGQWHWQSVTVTLRSTMDRFGLRALWITGDGTAISAYVDGAILVEGSAVFGHGEFSEGAYSLTIDDLESDTWYRIRAFAVNEAGVGHGDVVSCKTG